MIEHFVECFGLHYFIYHNTNVTINESMNTLNIAHYGLLLPLLVAVDHRNSINLDENMGIFGLITSEWRKWEKIKLFVDRHKYNTKVREPNFSMPCQLCHISRI